MERENIIQSLFTKQVVEGVLEVKCFSNLLQATRSLVNFLFGCFLSH